MHSRRSRGLIGAAVLVAGAAIGAVASGGAPDEAAEVGERAAREFAPPGDMVVIYDTGEVDQFVVDASRRVAAAAGGVSVTARTGSLGLRDLTRSGEVVHAPPSGYFIPIVFIAIPENPMGRIVGHDVPPAVSATSVVLNEVTAGIMGARVGDLVHVRSRSGAIVGLEIGAIRPPEQIGWAELVFTTEVAERLGFTWDTQVIIHDVDRSRIEPVLAEEGLADRTHTRIERSWDAFSPDSTIGTAQVKELLGEPWYRYYSDGSLAMHPEWIASNLTAPVDGERRILLNEVIRVRAQCHLEVVDDLRAALADVVAAGRASAIDWVNANRYGGCYNGARYSRLGGFLSRHSYGMAFDTNTVSDCQGCIPVMDCEVVRIFRRHGFAWGGNFRVPDGMHFEWVGEPRHEIAYPSTYCPNVVDSLTEALPSAELGAAVLVPDLEAAYPTDHDAPGAP